MFRRLLTHYEERTRLFGEMSARFGLGHTADLSMSDALALRQAVNRCLGCNAARQCAEWLARHDGRDGAPAFCPNVEALQSLGRMKAEPGHH